MTDHPDPKLVALHLCDEVARDSQNLPIVRSIYPGLIKCTTKPAFLPLTVFAAFELTSEAGARIELSMKGPGSRSGGEAEISGNNPYFDLDAKALFFVREAGEIEIKWRVAGKRWSKPRTWRVKFTDNARVLSDDEAVAVRKLFLARIDASLVLDEIREKRPRC